MIGICSQRDSDRTGSGTRKTPSWEDWYNWSDTQKETDKADCEHQEKEIQTTRTYEYDDNWELTRCTGKAEGGKRRFIIILMMRLETGPLTRRSRMVSAKQNITISTTIPTSSSNARMQRSGSIREQHTAMIRTVI